MHTLTANTRRDRLPLDTTTTFVGAAGQTTLTTERIDTRGYQGLVIQITFGAITSGGAQSIKARQSSDDAATDAYSDIAGTAQTVPDTGDNKIFEIEIWKPGKRYVDAQILRATQDSVVDDMRYILHSPVHAEPATQGAMIGGTERFQTPAEGTA